jgi:NAD(P)H-dependent FMN reductase
MTSTIETNNGTPIKVIGINGSLRPISYTRMALEVALEGAEEFGVETELVDLRTYDLVFCAGKDNEVTYPPDVFRLREVVKGAQGIILGTPEYHGSFSGVLKNALDLMGFNEFGGKMVGLVGVSGGAMGAFEALSSLRAVGRSLHAWVVPQQASVPQAWQKFDSDGGLADQRFEERLREVGRQVARFAYLHNSQEVLEFLDLWEKSQPNPGG